MAKFSEKQLLSIKCVSIFSTAVFWNICYFRNNLARYFHTFAYIFIYSCHILMKIEFSPQIFEKYSNTEFHENPPCGPELFKADKRRDSIQLTVGFGVFSILRKFLKVGRFGGGGRHTGEYEHLRWNFNSLFPARQFHIAWSMSQNRVFTETWTVLLRRKLPEIPQRVFFLIFPRFARLSFW